MLGVARAARAQRCVLVCFGLAFGGQLFAAPAFKDQSPTLPAAHIYAGGWPHFVGGGVAIFDCNGTGQPDIFAAGGTAPAALFVNISNPGGDIRFTNGDLPPITDVTGAYPVDVNNDDIIDLMVLRNGANILLRGLGDCQFTADDSLGLPADARWTTAFSATWESGQTLPTLAIGNYVDASNPNGPFGTCDTNWLIRPDGARYGVPTAIDPGFCPLSMLFSDWQRNGAPMLRISNDRQYYISDGYEQMWQLDPLRALTADDGWDRLQLWGMGIASRDITGDGLPEVMLTSMGDQLLMINQGDGFVAVPYATGSYAQRPFTGDDGRPSTGWHAEFGDIDNDGLPDLFIAKGNVDQMPDLAMRDPNNLLMQQPDGTFVEMADQAGIATMDRSRGAGLADLNGNGLLDIVVVNRRAPLEVWQNITPDAGNWIAVDLRQPAPNTRAIGAFVELRHGDTLQTREATIGGGHVSGSLIPLHFGLGDADDAQLRVIWPDGTATDWQLVAANQVVTITR
ncbi:MAG: CRTAC1 family protein [Yoonia sp.]|nr:CRTAC1 family protein [Yoonia sp.]